MEESIEVTESSGNLFTDLGSPRAYEWYIEALTEILAARCTRGVEFQMADPLRTDVESLATGLSAEAVVASVGAAHVATLLAAKYLGPQPDRHGSA